MPPELPLRCKCGRVRGVATSASADSGNRVVCYCADCQAFGRFVGQPGVLDAGGGTDIFQMAPQHICITEGAQLLRCVRLSEKGLYRWYTDCCRTPVGNMVGPRFPFIGVIHSFMDHAADGRTRDETLGKARGSLYVELASGPLPADAPPPASVRFFARLARTALGWWIANRGASSPFFDRKSRAPSSPPRILSPAERDALRVPPA